MTPTEIGHVRRRIRAILDVAGVICPTGIMPYYSDHPDEIVAIFDAMAEEGELREVGRETPAHFRVFVRTRQAESQRRLK